MVINVNNVGSGSESRGAFIIRGSGSKDLLRLQRAFVLTFCLNCLYHLWSRSTSLLEETVCVSMCKAGGEKDMFFGGYFSQLTNVRVCMLFCTAYAILHR